MENFVAINIKNLDFNDSLKFLEQFLPVSRKQKLNKQKLKKTQIISIVEYFLVKHALKIKGLPDFDYNENGKPSIKNSKHFNISHSGDWLVVATSNKPIGIDIQKNTPLKISVANRVCSESELNHLNTSTNQTVEFTKLWTMKESFVKMKGGSVFQNLKQVNVNQPLCTFEFFELKDYQICICEEK